MALATADVGAGAGLGATRLEGRCLHPPSSPLGAGKVVDRCQALG